MDHELMMGSESFASLGSFAAQLMWWSSHARMSAAVPNHCEAWAANEWGVVSYAFVHWLSFATLRALPQVTSPARAKHPAPASFCSARPAWRPAKLRSAFKGSLSLVKRDSSAFQLCR